MNKLLTIHKINVYSIASELHIFHELEFDMFMFITYIFEVTFVGNIRRQIGNTALH